MTKDYEPNAMLESPSRRVTHRALMTAEDEITLRAHLGLRRIPIISLAWVAASCVVTFWSLAASPPYTLDRWVDFGAKANAAILESGEWYRLVSAAFLHAHTTHLLFNSVYLLAFGGALESIFRHRHAAALFVIAAAVTSSASMWASTAVACGASGVVAAALATMTTLALTDRRFPRRLRITFLASCLPASVLFIAFSVFTVGVDHAGHAAGAMCGVLFAIWCPNRFDTSAVNLAPARAWLFAAALVLFGCLFGRESLGWESAPVRPTDDLSYLVPDTLVPLATGGTFRAYTNELGSTLVVVWGDLAQREAAYEDFLNGDLRRLRESEDVAEFGAVGPEHIQIGARPAHMLTLTYAGPRGPMLGRHVWVDGSESWLHIAFTGRAQRQAQNGELLRSFLSRLSFH